MDPSSCSGGFILQDDLNLVPFDFIACIFTECFGKKEKVIEYKKKPLRPLVLLYHKRSDISLHNLHKVHTFTIL